MLKDYLQAARVRFLGFIGSSKRAESFGQLSATWPGSAFNENPSAVCPIINRIFSRDQREGAHPFNLQVKGTHFQINVWKALMNIPEGCVVSHQDIASYIGQPKAFPAVANAIAINPVAYLVPCHRVIAKSGKIYLPIPLGIGEKESNARMGSGEYCLDMTN